MIFMENGVWLFQVPLPLEPFTVYLCGPITGEKVDHEWRDAATAFLNARGIRTLNPLRGKKQEDISDEGLSYEGQLVAAKHADRRRRRRPRPTRR